jgi:hypothetical protein
MKNPTIHQLRKEGLKVKVTHLRCFVNTTFNNKLKDVRIVHPLTQTDKNYTLFPRGGETIICITDKNGNDYIGYSRCSIADAYVKRQGINRALGRAYQVYLVNK